MSYNTDHLRTAGKITVYTTLLGVLIFAVVFIFNIGETTIKHADAQSTATTTVTVVNTPPLWTASSTELVESSATSPTNAGDVVSWVAVATDSNAENYWLLICSTSSAPTANSSAPPTCSNAGVQWARSATTTSGTQAIAATTTLDAWSESNLWFAFICDANAVTPRCNSTYSQGTNATNSSPFEVNHRPSFTVFSDNSPADPGQVVTFTTTSSDTDTSGSQDQVFLTVCATAGFSTTTNTCTGQTLATSTAYVNTNASASYTIIIPTQDNNYSAFGYVIDQHGFEATGATQGSDSTLAVNNVAPTVSGATISLVQPITTHMILTAEGGQTTGFSLSFTTSDNNSCDAAGGGAADEITGYDLALYRSGIGQSGCFATSTLNANNCYPSGVAPTAWNLTCTASTTSCAGSNDVDMTWNCTFPLWYIADPTGDIATSTPYFAQDWRAQVRGTDDDSLVGSYTESSTGVDVLSLMAFQLNTPSIVYGAVEPGQQTDPLVGTTTIAATGNVGLDKDVTGDSMCSGYTVASPCAPSATSTIPESEQRFATTKVAYGSATPLSSTTPQEIEVNVFKTTATSSPATGNAFWGIRVPGSITLAGDYTGRNVITARISETGEWGI